MFMYDKFVFIFKPNSKRHRYNLSGAFFYFIISIYNVLYAFFKNLKCCLVIHAGYEGSDIYQEIYYQRLQ